MSDFYAVVVYGKKPTHVLHALLTIFTCLLWGIIWIAVGLSTKERRVTLEVDPYGYVHGM